MKTKRRLTFVWVLLISIVFLLGILFLIYPEAATVSVNTEALYRLSSNDLERLKRKVDTSSDGDAAFKIALYYERSRKDMHAAFIWRKKAAEFGNKSALEWVDRFNGWNKQHDREKQLQESVSGEISK